VAGSSEDTKAFGKMGGEDMARPGKMMSMG